ncbi:helix-turn-helix domain-containing protein [Cohnella silvisoli]|uniref:Helix-turn-helix transcriptional regulator n=1 Tax=Cohnella silvisoli TaxID=2873699 RepID=A0ABV1KZQ0_9BACL|nr:helix-turn-helix transcriptional regulator [Cohnella silvisoli]MCD9024366.1 helix-turn-helix domain-containing protein [Cohnella silvisoli]
MSSKVGDYIRQKRKLKYPGLKEFAEATDVSVSQLSKIERGESHPTTETLDKISVALDDDKHTLRLLAGIGTEESIKSYLISSNYDSVLDSIVSAVPTSEPETKTYIQFTSRLSRLNKDEVREDQGDYYTNRLRDFLLKGSIGSRLFKETVLGFLEKMEGDLFNGEEIELLADEITDFYKVRRKALSRTKARRNHED